VRAFLDSGNDGVCLKVFFSRISSFSCLSWFGTLATHRLLALDCQIEQPWAADMAIRREHRKRAVICSEHEPTLLGQILLRIVVDFQGKLFYNMHA
jgi:hypothetical protein